MLVTEMPERSRASRRISLVKRRTPAVSSRSPAPRRRCDLVDLVRIFPSQIVRWAVAGLETRPLRRVTTHGYRLPPPVDPFVFR
jgi:hypothetical protein